MIFIDRPAGVTLIALYSGAMALLGIPGALVVFVISLFPGSALAAPVGAVLLVGGGACAAVAYGLWRLAPWGRGAGMWLYGLLAGAGLLSLAAHLSRHPPAATRLTYQLLFLLLHAGIVFYLGRPRVRERFARGP